MLGEYIGSIHTQVHKRPLVVERERINFGPRTEVNGLTVAPPAPHGALAPSLAGDADQADAGTDGTSTE